MIERVCKLEELSQFAKDILEFAKECRVILLRGDLASGKTTFVQEFSKALGLDVKVTSPTFSIQNCYFGRLYHYDIYQNGLEGFLSSGLLEELDRDGFHLIEWGDESLQRVLESYFMEYMVIEIKKSSEDSRLYKVTECTN